MVGSKASKPASICKAGICRASRHASKQAGQIDSRRAQGEKTREPRRKDEVQKVKFLGGRGESKKREQSTHTLAESLV